MIKHIYAYFNTLGGFYGKPFIEDLAPEDFVGAFTQSLYGAPKEVLESIKEDDLFYLGSFDNIKGVIIPNNENLIHLSEIAGKILLTKVDKVPGDTDVKEN